MYKEIHSRNVLIINLFYFFVLFGKRRVFVYVCICLPMMSSLNVPPVYVINDDGVSNISSFSSL